MSRFVRWLDRWIYVDRLRPGRVLPRFTARQWLRYVAVLAVLGPCFVVVHGAVEVLLAGVWAEWLLWLVADLVLVVALGAAHLLLLPEPADGRTPGLLTLVLFTASAMLWVVYGPAWPR